MVIKINTYSFQKFWKKYDKDQKIIQQDISTIIKSFNQTGTKIIITLPIAIFESIKDLLYVGINGLVIDW